mmetsp:Transcript_102575/g.177150  ORF Transcript_102575/g.177150 Transcript_102575/m.177150 type:complete len:87 (+) Transcript_102575:134-394(+)
MFDSPAMSLCSGRHGATKCFGRCSEVQWVEVMVRKLDTVLENLPAGLKHLPEYIGQEQDVNQCMKAHILLDALNKELFKLSVCFFL